MTSPIITEAVRALVDKKDLSRIEAAAAMEAIMSGAATNAQIAAFLTALRMKGETVEELIGFAQVMRQKAVRVKTHGEEVAALTGTDREMLIDTCGTGGDASGTFNGSTSPASVAGGGRRPAGHNGAPAPPAHGHEARDGGAPGAGHPDRVQHARAPHHPRRGQCPGHRRLRRFPHGAAGPGAGRAGHDPRFRRPRRRRAG